MILIKQPLTLWPFLSVVFVAAVVRYMPAAVFIPLGDLPGGEFRSEPTRISADGSTVVGWSAADRGREAFVWTEDDGMIGLGFLPGGTQSTALGVSGDGTTVVGFADNSDAPGLQAEAFVWTREEGMRPLGILPGGSDSRARAISADGSTIVGGSQRSDGAVEAFRWTRDEGLTGIGDLPGGAFNSAAQNVSEDGSMIVGYGNSDQGRRGFIWTRTEGMQSVFTDTEVVAPISINDIQVTSQGPVFVGEVNVGSENHAAVIYATEFIKSTYLFSDVPDNVIASAAYGTAAMYTVGTASYENETTAFAWSTQHGFRPIKSLLSIDHGLELKEWHLSTAVDGARNRHGFESDFCIACDGVFVGAGLDPQGNTQAYLVDLTDRVTNFEPLEGAAHWQSSPPGLFEKQATGFAVTRPLAPLRSDLLSPAFELLDDTEIQLDLTYSWRGGSGQFTADIVSADDANDIVYKNVYYALVNSQATQATGSRAVDRSRLASNTKYRLRFRYYDYDTILPSIGPMSLEGIRLTGVTFIVPGDTNGDAVVDLVDLNNVRNNFGVAGAGVVGDTNYDDVVDLTDLNNIRNHFGEVIGGIGNSVPEPNSLMLCAISIVLAISADCIRLKVNCNGKRLLPEATWPGKGIRLSQKV